MLEQWSGVTPRFAAYCIVHGARTAAVMITSDKARFPGGKMAGFVIWIGQKWREWQRETGHRGAKSREDHDAFDVWLWQRINDRLMAVETHNSLAA